MPPRRLSLATLGQLLLAAAAFLWGLQFARFTLATLFATHDDEGYFLLSIARYFRPGPLDPATYTNYGPFFFYAQQAAYRLIGLPVSHDSGRLVTLLFWTASALCAAWFVYRASRNLLLAAAALLACFQLAAFLAQEPGHPQQVILLIFTLAICCAAPRRGPWFLLLGALGAALCLTKINVGVFFLAALAHALVCLLPASRLRSAALAALLAYALFAPPLLARAHLAEGAGGFAFVAALTTAVTFFWGSRLRPAAPLRFRQAMLACAGTAGAAALLTLAAMLQGVSLPTLIEGVILEPARHPSGLLFLGFRLGLFPCLAAVATLAALSAFALLQPRLAPCGPWLATWLATWLGALRCAAALAAIVLLLRHDLSWVLPLLPLGVIPLTRRSRTAAEWFPRIFLADLAATEFLQTYPTAGSHVGLSAIPVLLWAFLAFSDGVEELAPLAPAALCRSAASAVLLLGIATTIWSSGTRPTGLPYPPSRLKGAESLHLPPQQSRDFQRLSRAVSANCSVLFTLPRFHSLNLWSAVSAPPESELPVTPRMFTPAIQAAVLQRLQADPRSCALYNREMLEFWQIAPRDAAQQPLSAYVLQTMPIALTVDGYELRIHPARPAPPNF